MNFWDFLYTNITHLVLADGFIYYQWSYPIPVVIFHAIYIFD